MNTQVLTQRNGGKDQLQAEPLVTLSNMDISREITSVFVPMDPTQGRCK